MSVLDTLERLQSAPPHKRKAALAVIVGILMVVVIGLWILQLKYESRTASQKAGAQESWTAPFSIIWKSIKDSMDNFYEGR